MRMEIRRRPQVVVPLLLLSLTAARETHGQNPPIQLIEAAKNQDRDVVAALLSRGADVNATQADGASALHWAAYRDDLETANLLLRAGAAVGATNDLGASPLWLACNNASAAMVERLLTAKANPNAALPSGETILMTAARTGNEEAVRSLIAHGADVNAAEDSRGQTALMWAVAQKHSAVVQVLLEHGADVNARTHSSMQVINSAGNADPSGVYEIQAGGSTPLLFAARQGDVDSATLLLAAGADVNDTAPMGTSALVVAAHSGHGVLARLLLDKGADPNAAEAGYTALHAAVLRGDLRLVEALVAHGAGPNASLTRGTPARRVSRDWSLGHHLIGATPFWLAARFREPGIMRVLADHGADPLFVRDGTTAVMAALRGGSTRARFGVRPADQDEEERRTLDAVELALDVGVDVSIANDNGDTALHIAASRQFDTAIQLLASRGAVLDVRNKRGQTPLALASTGPRGLAALYNPTTDSSSTVALLRRLGATDEGENADKQSGR